MSPKYTAKQLQEKFWSMKPLEEMLKDGDICAVPKAAKLTGFSEQHLRRLCADKKVEHERRMGHYFFTPLQIAKLRPQTVTPAAS